VSTASAWATAAASENGRHPAAIVTPGTPKAVSAADADAVGLIDFEDAFLRLSQTGFRLSAQAVGILRQNLADFGHPQSEG
jgi:hypothetical protein